MLEQALLAAIQIQVQLFQENVPKEEDKKGFLQDEIKECQSVINRCRTRYATLFEDYAEGCISKGNIYQRSRRFSYNRKK